MGKNTKMMLVELNPPEWVESWVKRAVEILQSTINAHTNPQQFAHHGFYWKVSADEIFLHCVILASKDWDAICESDSSPDYTHARFLLVCTLFELEAKYRIEALLSRSPVVSGH